MTTKELKLEQRMHKLVRVLHADEDEIMALIDNGKWPAQDAFTFLNRVFKDAEAPYTVRAYLIEGRANEVASGLRKAHREWIKQKRKILKAS